MAERITISGKVIPREWDRQDNVSAVSIITDEDFEYLIEEGGKVKSLIDDLHEWVKAEISITQKSEDEACAIVHKYELLDDFEDFDDDDFQDDGYDEED